MLRTIVHLMPFLDGIRLRLLTTLLLVAVSTGFSCAIPYLFKAIVDHLSVVDSAPPLIIAALLCGYGISWTVSQLMIQLRTMAIYVVLERSKKLLSTAIVDKLLSLTAHFHIERQTGELTNSIDKAQRGLDSIFWGILLFFVPTSLEIIVACLIIASSCGIVHGIALCIGVLFYVYVSYQSLNAMTDLQSEHNEATSRVTARLVDILLNIETVKNFAHERYEQDRMNQLLNKQEHCAIKRWREDSWLQIKQMLIIGLGIWVVTVYTGL